MAKGEVFVLDDGSRFLKLYDEVPQGYGPEISHPELKSVLGSFHKITTHILRLSTEYVQLTLEITGNGGKVDEQVVAGRFGQRNRMKGGQYVSISAGKKDDMYLLHFFEAPVSK